MVVVERQMKKLPLWPPTSSSSIAQVELVDLVVKEMVYAVGQVMVVALDYFSCFRYFIPCSVLLIISCLFNKSIMFFGRKN